MRCDICSNKFEYGEYVGLAGSLGRKIYCEDCLAERRRDIIGLKELPRAELELVPYDKLKWQCMCKGCNNSVVVWDFASWPWYYWPRGVGKWISIHEHFYLCSRHTKFYNRLSKKYGVDRTNEKLLDYKKTVIFKL